MRTYIIVAAAALVCGLIIVALRTPGTLKKIIGSAAVGFAALAAVNLSASVTGVGLAISGWTIAVAGFLGLPGVISMLFLKMIWKI